MYRIDHVRIEGFWGRYTAEAELHNDVNIFIGQNGSGKTTFMDLLQGALRADLRILGAHEFSAITIKLREANRQRTIKVTKERGDATPVDIVRFQVGTRAFHLPLYSPEMDSVRHMRVRPRLAQTYEELRHHIAGLLQVASLSVHRAAFEQISDEEFTGRRRQVRPPLDVRLEELLQRLTAFQLELAQQANAVSVKFQKDVLASILFDKRYDTFSWSHISQTDLSQHQEQLTRAYSELGALTKPVEARIAQHIKAIEKSVAAVDAFDKAPPDKKTIEIDAILPFPLHRRSQHIVELLSEAENAKRDVFGPIRGFVKTLHSFIKDKKIAVTPSGEFTVQRDGRRVAVPQLSSGEKQLFILLTETLLQRKQPFVFLADEPELSLHIEWQAQIIGSLKKLNENAQVVVATHSPEIAAGWKERIIDMAEVVSA